MQSVHHPAVHAAVQWAEEKLSINLQHFIPLQSSADCSESLQIMWEHNTLSLNFHLIISWVRTFMYFSASVIAIVSFSGCYLEAFCNFASILKHCKEFTASMRQPLLPPKYFLFSSIQDIWLISHWVPLSSTFSWQIWYNFSIFLTPTWVQTGSEGLLLWSHVNSVSAQSAVKKIKYNFRPRLRSQSLTDRN